MRAKDDGSSEKLKRSSIILVVSEGQEDAHRPMIIPRPLPATLHYQSQDRAKEPISSMAYSLSLSLLGKGPVRVNQDLHIAILPPIEFLVRFWRIINPHFMTYNKARFRSSRDDHIPQVAIVGLHIALPSGKMKTLCED